MPVGRLLWFWGKRVVLLIEDCLDLPVHVEAEGAVLVVSVNVDTGVLFPFPVSGDGTVLFQIREEVFGVAFLHILNTKIIYY